MTGRMPIKVALAIAAMASTAGAEPQRLAIPTPPTAFVQPSKTRAGAPISNVIYLERCVGGCAITGGSTNDARTLTTTIPSAGTYTISEFENSQHQTGAAADAEWADLVTCVQEVYSPFDVVVTDVKPTSGSYHLAIVAGRPQQLGLDANVLGVAPLATNCAAFDNVISFSFSNAHPQSDPTLHVQNVCWTAAQESAHAYGLDHEYSFVDGRSACNDPMTYRVDCGGEKFFRNVSANCGEDTERDCRCTATQNSHRTLEQLFGSGTPLYAAPTVTLQVPSEGGGQLPGNVIAEAGAQRGVSKVSLFLNGFPMVDVPGAPFGTLGQPTTSYGMLIPSNTPHSIYDLFVRACDDLGDCTDTPAVTVTNVEPCTTADACLDHQKCEAGKCFWDPPVKEIGDECSYPQECKSLLCRGTSDLQICTQTCDPTDSESCPSGMSCFDNVCFVDGGGCCSTSRGDWAPAGLLAFVALGLVLRRRRR